MLEYIFNGSASGNVGAKLLEADMNPQVLRPFKDPAYPGKSFITLGEGAQAKTVLVNTSSTLRREDWIKLDEAIVKVAKARLAAVKDLRAAGLELTIENGMGKTMLQTERQSDIAAATISMDGMRRGNADRPVFDITNLPLPISHYDFGFSARQLAASRNGGSPLDTTTAELAARRVAEQVEALYLGTASSFSYGGGVVYGLTNFPSRNTQILTAPTHTGWTPETTLNEVLQMRFKSQSDNMFGPWVLYCSLDWDIYMDADYKATNTQSTTLRDRLKMIKGISDVRTLDYLPQPFTLVLVQMTADVVRMVIGMEITTVQWESEGGMAQNFKVMTIMVPQLRADYLGQCGIVHGAPA